MSSYNYRYLRVVQFCSQEVHAIREYILFNPAVPQNIDDGSSPPPASTTLTMLKLSQAIDIPTPMLATTSFYAEEILYSDYNGGVVHIPGVDSNQELALFQLVYNSRCQFLEGYGPGMLCAFSNNTSIEPGKNHVRIA